jgi:hypothetical protein
MKKRGLVDGKRFWRVPSTKRAVFMDDRWILISLSTKRHDFVDRNRGLGNPSTETGVFMDGGPI